MWRETTLLVVLLLLIHRSHARCLPSSCGNITHITYPFRLQADPEKCGNKRYELVCENNVTVLYLHSAKYHVQAINYNNYTVRVVDPALQLHNCVRNKAIKERIKERKNRHREFNVVRLQCVCLRPRLH